MAVKIVQTILKQNTAVGSLEQVDMLFDFIQPLVHDLEGEAEEDEDDEVRTHNDHVPGISFWGY